MRSSDGELYCRFARYLVVGEGNFFVCLLAYVVLIMVFSWHYLPGRISLELLSVPLMIFPVFVVLNFRGSRFISFTKMQPES
jgi:hypothetical protein